jgi:hypothetical protein
MLRVRDTAAVAISVIPACPVEEQLVAFLSAFPDLFQA